ncbi:MAG: MFS transporter [Anaerolineales bacterium]|nr:MFS transporter [Anaerolineales bacterium]
MRQYLLTVRSFSPSLRRFLLSSSLMTTVAFGLSAVLQNLYFLRLGFDARFIGLVLGAGQLAWAVAALPAGMVSSRIGLRNGYMLGPALFAVGTALMLLVETQPEAIWPAWLIGSQVVLMVGTAFITVNVAPYLMSVTGERERRHAFAVFQALIPATAFLGSVMAGLLPGFFAERAGASLEAPEPYRLALWFGPLLALLSILPLLGADRARVVIEGAGEHSSMRAPLRLLLIFGVIVFLQAAGEGAVRGFFNVYLDAGLAIPLAEIGGHGDRTIAAYCSGPLAPYLVNGAPAIRWLAPLLGIGASCCRWQPSPNCGLRRLHTWQSSP